MVPMFSEEESMRFLADLEALGCKPELAEEESVAELLKKEYDKGYSDAIATVHKCLNKYFKVKEKNKALKGELKQARRIIELQGRSEALASQIADIVLNNQHINFKIN